VQQQQTQAPLLVQILLVPLQQTRSQQSPSMQSHSPLRQLSHSQKRP
jgi:hypothetical protein